MITKEMITETISGANSWLYEVENLTDQLCENDISLAAEGATFKTIRDYLNWLKKELIDALEMYDEIAA